MKIKCKDFDIISFHEGNRIAGKPQYAYRVIYNSPDGRTAQLKETFYTKESAKKYISKTVKKANMILKSK